MSVTVRKAVAGDVPRLLEQLLAFDAFFGSSRSLFPDQEYAERTMYTLIEQHPFFVAEQHGSAVQPIVGFIGGALGPHPFNPHLTVLSELFWWVDVEWRGSRAGLALLNEFVAFGKANADWVVMTLEDESPVNPNTLYRRGFRLKEISYLLECA